MFAGKCWGFKTNFKFCFALGATVNMDGTALYECIAVLFIAQVWDPSEFSAQFTIVVLALLTSIGVAEFRLPA